MWAQSLVGCLIYDDLAENKQAGCLLEIPDSWDNKVDTLKFTTAAFCDASDFIAIT